jgi:hypothetical protein
MRDRASIDLLFAARRNKSWSRHRAFQHSRTPPLIEVDWPSGDVFAGAAIPDRLP